MTLAELAAALDALVATAREGKTQPADMAGGTITITNVGVFGVDTGTPILNPGESAILRSARSGTCPGSSTGRLCRARSRSWRCRSTTGWSTGSSALDSWPTWRRYCQTPSWRSPGARPDHWSAPCDGPRGGR